MESFMLGEVSTHEYQKQIKQIKSEIKVLQEKSAKQKDISEFLNRAEHSYTQVLKHYTNVLKLKARLETHYTRENYLALFDEFDRLNYEMSKHRRAINTVVNHLTDYVSLALSTSLAYQRLKFVFIRMLQGKEQDTSFDVRRRIYDENEDIEEEFDEDEDRRRNLTYLRRKRSGLD